MQHRLGPDWTVPRYFVAAQPIVVWDWVSWNGARHRVPKAVPWSGWRFRAWRL